MKSTATTPFLFRMSNGNVLLKYKDSTQFGDDLRMVMRWIVGVPHFFQEVGQGFGNIRSEEELGRIGTFAT